MTEYIFGLASTLETKDDNLGPPQGSPSILRTCRSFRVGATGAGGYGGSGGNRAGGFGDNGGLPRQGGS